MAAEGFSGEYEVTVRRIWGKPLGSKAKLVIIKHQGTPDETRQEVVIRLDKKHTVKVDLADGRRQKLAEVPPPGAYKRPEAKEPQAQTSQILVKLRNLADPEYTGVESGTRGGMGSLGGSSVPAPAPKSMAGSSPGDQSYQARVSPLGFNSVDLTAQAVVSGDRRYVRLSVNANFLSIPGLGLQPPTGSIPGIPGGAFSFTP